MDSKFLLKMCNSDKWKLVLQNICHKLVRKKFANILCVNTVCLLFAIIVTLFVYNAKKFCYNVNIGEKY